MNLNAVLLALKNYDYWIEPAGKSLQFYISVYSDEAIIGGISKQLFTWDLAKETLEEQLEETQIVIFKLFGLQRL